MPPKLRAKRSGTVRGQKKQGLHDLWRGFQERWRLLLPESRVWMVPAFGLIILAVAVIMITRHFFRPTIDQERIEPCLILTEWTLELHLPGHSLYDILQVPTHATPGEIQTAYFERASKLQCASQMRSPIAGQVCQELRLLTRAAQILGNTGQRKRYDMQFWTLRNGAQQKDVVKWADKLQQFCGFGLAVVEKGLLRSASTIRNNNTSRSPQDGGMCPTNDGEHLCTRPISRIVPLILGGHKRGADLPHISVLVCPDVLADMVRFMVRNPPIVHPHNYKAILRTMGDFDELTTMMRQARIWPAISPTPAEFKTLIASIFRYAIGEILLVAYHNGFLQQMTEAPGWAWQPEGLAWSAYRERLLSWLEFTIWGFGNPNPQVSQSNLGSFNDVFPGNNARAPDPNQNPNPTDTFNNFYPRQPPAPPPTNPFTPPFEHVTRDNTDRNATSRPFVPPPRPQAPTVPTVAHSSQGAAVNWEIAQIAMRKSHIHGVRKAIWDDRANQMASLGGLSLETRRREEAALRICERDD
ncbi:hypothetical protein QBC47DRAFT_441629 [Echria macrotheca]|uniref:J domain-containing protein n=1 Tax=Echria macrotheca TaxID=438768 RepID=A0AAJ0EZY7_9PEZI|nr:hypothetical protein QBC47DRAFT_441629 [Echria macrotheca]